MIGSILITLLSGLGATAQSVDGNGCLRLLGSVACPGFQYAYLSPANLSNAFPFFSSVSSVSTFDVAALNYFTSPDQFETTKFTDQLGCSNASSAVIRYERTVLCSMWVNERWSEQCLANYNGTTAATSQKMVCQDTCLLYSASETSIVNSATYCPGPDLTNGNRTYQLNKDFVDCTDWTTLATNETGSCVTGEDNNDVNCGFGTSVGQLCELCRGDVVEDCCYTATTDLSVCGYTLPVRANTTSTSSAAPSSTAGISGANAGSSSRLSKGALAGIIVGSVLGGPLLLALLALCCIRRRKRSSASNANRNSTSSYPPNSIAQTSQSGHGVFGSMFSTNPSSGQNASEKGLIGAQSAAAKSSPTMGGDTLYSGKNGAGAGGSGSDAGLLAAGMGMGAAGAGIPGERTSGVVLPRVRDENQSGDRWIETGAEVSVLWPYQASLPDELDLRPGMKLKVLRLYDDAWGTAQVISGGEQGSAGKTGAFPIVCVSEGSSLGSSAGSSSAGH